MIKSDDGDSNDLEAILEAYCFASSLLGLQIKAQQKNLNQNNCARQTYSDDDVLQQMKVGRVDAEGCGGCSE